MSQKRCHVTLKLDFDENTRIYADYRSSAEFSLFLILQHFLVFFDVIDV